MRVAVATAKKKRTNNQIVPPCNICAWASKGPPPGQAKGRHATRTTTLQKGPGYTGCKKGPKAHKRAGHKTPKETFQEKHAESCYGPDTDKRYYTYAGLKCKCGRKNKLVIKFFFSFLSAPGKTEFGERCEYVRLELSFKSETSLLPDGKCDFLTLPSLALWSPGNASRVLVIFSTLEKMVITKARSWWESLKAARRMARKIQKLGYPVRFGSFCVENLVVTVSLKTTQSRSWKHGRGKSIYL